MNCNRWHFLCNVSLCLAIMSAGSAYAKDIEEAKPPVRFTTDMKASATFEDDMDLGTDNEGRSQSQSLEIKPKIEGKISDVLSFLVEARGVKNYGEGGSIDPETNEPEGLDDFLELRQFWAEFGNFGRGDSVTGRVGRQRIREEYGFWWNRDQDAARVLFNKEKIKGFIGLGQNLTEYRSTGDYFNKDDEDLLRLFGEASMSWLPGHNVELRGMYQDDRSDLESTGSLVKSDDYDPDDPDLFWMGLRLKGHLGEVVVEDSKDEKRIAYRVDFAAVTGEEDSITSSAGPGIYRTVTGRTDQDVFGWAFDGGLDLPVTMGEVNPVFHFGYAFGSGDGNSSDGQDDAFRQTGLDGNSSRLSGFSSPINNYGSVLRPDLSNIHVASVGFTIPVAGATDLAGYYRYYRLAEENGEISSAISAPLSGNDSDLGQGFDLVLNSNVDEQFNLQQDYLDRINFRTTLGAFKAGDAYGATEEDMALRAQFDLNLRF